MYYCALPNAEYAELKKNYISDWLMVNTNIIDKNVTLWSTCYQMSPELHISLKNIAGLKKSYSQEIFNFLVAVINAENKIIHIYFIKDLT